MSRVSDSLSLRSNERSESGHTDSEGMAEELFAMSTLRQDGALFLDEI